jgi:multidrug efflux system membrane fusion protein
MIPPANPARLLLAALAASAMCTACADKAASTPQAPAPPPVVVGQAVRRTVPVALRGIGNVESVASVAVRSRVAGQVLKVHIQDGADVQQGQLLFTIDPAPHEIAVAQAEAQLARDQALLKKAQDDAERYATLVEKEYVTKEQYEAATSQAAALAATILSDEATANDAKLSLSYCTITAPISGRAGVVNLRAGNLVKVNDDPPLVTILKVEPVDVTFSVPEKYLSEVRTRFAAGPLTVRATERGKDKDDAWHPGRLVFIDNTVDTTTGTIRLKAEFPNEDRGLWPGQYVETELILREQKDALIVPSTAIQVGQDGSFVFVVSPDGTAQPRPVVVDRLMGDETVLVSGLDGGETVITDGQIRVVPGGKVAVGEKS